jgi:hypothetical protein
MFDPNSTTWPADPLGFKQWAYQMGRAAEGVTGIPAMVSAAVAINETGSGRYLPDRAGFNFFGIKGPGTSVPTQEWVDGHYITITDSFGNYQSPLAAFVGFGNFLHENSRYRGALNTLQATGDPNAFIRQVHAAGYATSPTWSDQIIGIMNDLKATVVGNDEPIAPPTVSPPARRRHPRSLLVCSRPRPHPRARRGAPAGCPTSWTCRTSPSGIPPSAS